MGNPNSDTENLEILLPRLPSLTFCLVSCRYDRCSLQITTSTCTRDWPGNPAADEILATAIVDQLLRSSHVLDFKGAASGYAKSKAPRR